MLTQLQQSQDLSNFVRLYRDYAGITQAQLAQMVGCSKTQITRMETGHYHEIRATWYIASVCLLISKETGIPFNYQPYLNCAAQSNNSTGYRGVCYSPVRQKFIATITHKGKHFFLGYYRQLEDAVAIRQAAEAQSAQGISALEEWFMRTLKQDKSS